MRADQARAPRYTRRTYLAPILGGYEMSYDHAPSDGAWRVLAIPGTPSRPHMFSRFMAVAPDDLDVIAVNRAGYGGPVYGPNARAPVLSFDDQVRALAPLFDIDDGKRTIVVGVSYGGALALKTALDYPRRIVGAVTVAMLVNEPRRYVLATTRLAGLPLVREALPAYLHTARAEVAGRRSQIGPLFERLKGLDIPVTAMHGDLDTLVPMSALDELVGYFGPGADLEIERVRGGTHYLELQFPNRIYKAIRGVIARADGVAKTRGR